MRADRRWAVLVHGGAKDIHPADEQANRDGIREAVAAGSRVLATGGSALDAVQEAIRVLEDLPVFNAGRGACTNAAGQVEMSAGLMNGRDRAVGGVAALHNVRNPVLLARHVLAEREVLLAGEGAMAFAREKQLAMEPDEYFAAARHGGGEHDTVGAVAFDLHGDFAAGASTGGLPGTRVGRIGDSPVAGAGYYAQNGAGAVSLSGDGESILRVAAAAQIMARLDELGPEAAITRALEQLPIVGGAEGDGGAIAITAEGRVGWNHNSPHFAVAMATSEAGQPSAWLSKQEEQNG